MTDTVRGTIMNPITGELVGPGTDPYVYRWRGTAFQGEGRPEVNNGRFDTTLITRLTSNLHVGGCIGGLHLPGEVDLVVSLYPWERYVIRRDTVRTEITAYDATGQDLGWAEAAAMVVAGGIEEGLAVLTHCQAGINRSSLVAGIALLELGWVDTGADAISLLREERSPACLCNATFEQYLRDRKAD